MNNEIKLNLNIKLPGRVMMSEQLCSENSDYEELIFYTFNKKGKKEFNSVKTRSTIPATQSINITKEAYDYFISKENPYFISNRLWSKMSKKERLKAHLDNICESLNGISYTYKVFDD